MAKRKPLTKAWLEKVGVEYVSEDGETIILKGRVKKHMIIGKKHPYGNEIKYKYISIYDPENPATYVNKVYISRKTGKPRPYKGRQIKTSNVAVSRIVYAWYKGDVPADMDVDHIDGNTFNNHIDNLQLLTRRENLARRILSWSEITRMYNEVKKKQKREDDDTYVIYNKIGEDR